MPYGLLLVVLMTTKLWDWNNIMMENLVNRIIADNVCVIEGSESELLEAAGIIAQWRMSEECKERKINHAWIRQLNDADHAIRRRVTELKAIDKATD